MAGPANTSSFHSPCLLVAHQSTNCCFIHVHHLLSSISLIHTDPNDPVFSHCELDSHADTCVLGCNFMPLSYTGRVCDVSPYNAEHGICEKNVPIVTGATAYTCQSSGQTFILVINEGLWFGSRLSHSLFNHPEVTIPLNVTGTIIYLDSHTPTQHELDTCPHIHLTSTAE